MASSAELLQAVQLATRTLAGAGQIDKLLPDVLAICVKAVGASGGTIYIHDELNKTLIFRHVLPEEVRAKLQFNNIPEDFGVAGQAFMTGKTVISEFDPKPDLNEIESQTGVQVRNMITVPLQMEDEPPIGVVQLINKVDGMFVESDVTVLDTVSAVATLAYLNAKLTDESTRASTLLGMGKVSHDIGNLAASLFATIQFSGMSIDALESEIETGNKAALAQHAGNIRGSVDDLATSVERIVGYSRLISDLSAGRQLRPSKAPRSLAETVSNSAAYLETEGRNNHVLLRYQIAPNGPEFLHDELFIFRIVQNLVGNAIKAVRETAPIDLDSLGEEDVVGEVTVAYRFEDGKHWLEVTDSGPGMTKEIADRILSGNARSAWGKGGGSGWGTKIVLELAHSHDGVVEIDSTPGSGATFRVTFPDTKG